MNYQCDKQPRLIRVHIRPHKYMLETDRGSSTEINIQWFNIAMINAFKKIKE